MISFCVWRQFVYFDAYAEIRKHILTMQVIIVMLAQAICCKMKSNSNIERWGKTNADIL